MNKRSAMMVAAGLVLTLVVGGVALAVGMVGPAASAAGPRMVRREHPKPIVKTTKRTVKVHRSGGVVAVPMSTGSQSSGITWQGSSGSSGSSDDQSQTGDHQSGDQYQTGGDGYDDHGNEPGDDGSSGGDD